MPDSAPLDSALLATSTNRLAALPKDFGQQFVGRRQPGLGVYQEQRAVGLVHRHLALGAHAALERVGPCDFKAGGVDHAEPEVDQLGVARTPVAGDARRVVDQRQLAAGQTVEQGRLADIRASDDGEGDAHGWSLPAGQVSVRGAGTIRMRRPGRQSCRA